MNLNELMYMMRPAPSVRDFGTAYYTPKNRAYRRKRNRRLRAAHGGTIPKRYR